MTESSEEDGATLRLSKNYGSIRPDEFLHVVDDCENNRGMVGITQKLSPSQIDWAKSEIQRHNKNFEKNYLGLLRFLSANPSFVVKLRGNNPPRFGTREYFVKTADMFAAGRVITPPINSGKTSDPLLGSLFQQLNSCTTSEVENAIRIHADFMVLENKVGKILEHYLSSRLEPLGWIWCSGDFVEKVDFIKLVSGDNYEFLQVKNKDVTENSSSAKGRGDVPKWARLKGKKAIADWDNFPDLEARKLISEADFLEYGKSIGHDWLSSN